MNPTFSNSVIWDGLTIPNQSCEVKQVSTKLKRSKVVLGTFHSFCLKETWPWTQHSPTCHLPLFLMDLLDYSRVWKKANNTKVVWRTFTTFNPRWPFGPEPNLSPPAIPNGLTQPSQNPDVKWGSLANQWHTWRRPSTTFGPTWPPQWPDMWTNSMFLLTYTAELSRC